MQAVHKNLHTLGLVILFIIVLKHPFKYNTSQSYLSSFQLII
jgi:hypothetical protein